MLDWYNFWGPQKQPFTASSANLLTPSFFLRLENRWSRSRLNLASKLGEEGIKSTLNFLFSVIVSTVGELVHFLSWNTTFFQYKWSFSRDFNEEKPRASQQTDSVTLPADGIVFTFFGSGSSLVGHCFDCYLVSGMSWRTEADVTAVSYTHLDVYKRQV